MNANKRLGRGLDALLNATARKAERHATPDIPVATPPDEAADDADFVTREMPLTALTPGRYQPRLAVAEDSLAELADSIREQGVLQPLVVRPIEATVDNAVHHEIVAGERRWRAAQLAGLDTVPVVVRALDDRSALAVALIENLQREDLNPIEQARSLSQLAEEFSLTHQEVAESVGRSRSGVSNLLRLLELDEQVKTQLATGRIDMGHARALLSLDAESQVRLAKQAEKGAWSVRQTERAVRTHLARADRTPAARTTDLQTRWLQQQLASEVGRKVTLKPLTSGGYKLDVTFAGLDELHELLGRVQTLADRVRDAAGPRVRDADN